MKNMKTIQVLLLLTVSVFIFNSCSSLKQITQSLTNLERLQFKLDDVDNFRLSGISINNKKSVSDFSITDGLSLANNYRQKKLPAEFIINVAAKNPNDGSGKSTATTATLTALDWKLYIDDKETIAGNIDKPIEIPGTGQSTIIPLKISLDLYKFFGEKGYDDLIQLAMAIGGVNGSASRLKIDARPTVSTPLGPISYPGRINIIDKQFTN